jgi:hypothetical protein
MPSITAWIMLPPAGIWYCLYRWGSREVRRTINGASVDKCGREADSGLLGDSILQ